MNFLHPLFLVGLLGISVPIFLHLFGRRPSERVLFPPVEFLKLVALARRRRSRWREMILLLLRVGILSCLTLALARPFLSKDVAEGGHPRTLIVLDNSFSMAAQLEGRTLWERAKSEARSLIGRGNSGDSFSVLSLVGGEASAFTNDRIRLDLLIEKLPQTFETGAFLPALQAYQTGAENAELLSDVRFITDGTDVPWRAAAAGLPAGTVHVEDVTDGRRLQNRSITDIEWEDRSESGSPQLSLRAHVNGEMGATQKIAVSVETFDGKSWYGVSQKTIGITDGGVVAFEVPLPDREVPGRVRIEEDAFGYDNSAYFVASPWMRRRIAVLNGNPRPEARNDAAFFLVKALRPEESGAGPDAFQVSEWSESDVSRESLKGVDVLILADTGTLQGDLKSVLSEFVDRGGGLIVGVGESYAEGRTPEALEGLLPARLRPAITLPSGSDVTMIPPDETDLYPMLSPRWNESFGGVRFHKILATEPLASDSVRLKYSNGLPALVFKTEGKGRVVLFTSSFGQAWNDFGISSGFPAWLRRTVVLSAEGSADRQAKVLRLRTAGARFPENVKVAWIDPPDASGKDVRPGFVRVGDHDNWVLEGDREESDFTPVDRPQAEIAARPLKLDWSKTRSITSENRAMVSKISEQSERWAMVALLLVLLESILAGRLPWKRKGVPALPVILAAIFGILPGRVSALSDEPTISIGELKLSIPAPYRNPIDPLLRKARDVANLETPALVPKIELSDRRLFDFPLVYFAGDRAFSLPSAIELSRLRRHLSIGGTLIIDNATASASGGFHDSVLALAKALFPDLPLSPVKRDHVLFQSYYLIDRLPGRGKEEGELYSVDLKRRTAIFYFTGDLAGEIDPEIEKDSFQRTNALRLGVNLLMYAVTLDYKRDQIHLPFILERRR